MSGVRTKQADLTLEALTHAAWRFLNDTPLDGWPPAAVSRANLQKLLTGQLTPTEYLAVNGGH